MSRSGSQPSPEERSEAIQRIEEASRELDERLSEGANPLLIDEHREAVNEYLDIVADGMARIDMPMIGDLAVHRVSENVPGYNRGMIREALDTKVASRKSEIELESLNDEG